MSGAILSVLGSRREEGKGGIFFGSPSAEGEGGREGGRRPRSISEAEAAAEANFFLLACLLVLQGNEIK